MSHPPATHDACDVVMLVAGYLNGAGHHAELSESAFPDARRAAEELLRAFSVESGAPRATD